MIKHRLMAKGLVLCLLVSAAAISGCSKQASSKGDSSAGTTAAVETGTDAESGAQTEESLGEEDMDMVKYNVYVELNNYMVRVLDDIGGYYTVVEYADEFAMVPDSGYSYKYDISPLDSSIVDDAVSVASMEPAYEKLDDLALQIADPMKTLMDTFSDLYSCNDFADNQYAKAKEFHVPIQENAAVFEELAYEFIAALDELSEERVGMEEQQMLDDGELIAYNASHMITLGSKILDECYRQEISDENIIELDLTEIRPLYEELAATVAAYQEAVSDNDQLVKESLSNSTPLYGLPDSLLQSVEWMIKQVESQTPIEDPGSEFLGGIIHVQEVLSKCIDQYNAVFAE